MLLLVNDLNPLGQVPTPEPRATIYTVQPGDSLRLIAKRFLRNEARSPEIFDANRDKLASPNAIRVSQQLAIPITLSIYVVHSGEALGSIARLGLGDASRWSEIFDLNRDRIQNPNVMRVGQELRVPFTLTLHIVQLGELPDGGKHIGQGNRGAIKHIHTGKVLENRDGHGLGRHDVVDRRVEYGFKAGGSSLSKALLQALGGDANADIGGTVAQLFQGGQWMGEKAKDEGLHKAPAGQLPLAANEARGGGSRSGVGGEHRL